jgi:hypothetical protein
VWWPSTKPCCRGCEGFAQDTSAPAEEEFRPPSPKYDERTFFMSTQNPWVATRSAASPNKRSPAVARRAANGAVSVTPPVFNLAYSGAPSSSAGKRSHAMTEASGRNPAKAPSDADVGDVPDRPAQAGDHAAEAGGAAMRVGDAMITPPGGPVVQAPPDGIARRAGPDESTLPAQKRARLESQACFLREPNVGAFRQVLNARPGEQYRP